MLDPPDSKVYERGNLRRGIYGRGRPKLEDDSVASSNDVLERTAKDLGIPKRTIARARQYDEATAKYPEFKKHTVNVALKKYKLYAELSKVYERGKGSGPRSDDGKFTESRSVRLMDDVLERTAKDLGVLSTSEP